MAKKKKQKTLLRWMCGICNSIQTSDSSERWHMTVCDCGKSMVDLEEYYQRNIGKVIEIERSTVDDD